MVQTSSEWRPHIQTMRARLDKIWHQLEIIFGRVQHFSCSPSWESKGEWEGEAEQLNLDLKEKNVKKMRSLVIGVNLCNENMQECEENLAGKLGGNVGNEGGGKLDAQDGDRVPSL